MKVSDIINQEDDQNIYLHKEGVFWKAYEYSAYAFVKNVRPYNVRKKFFKILDKEIVYLGFPDEAMKKVLYLCAEKGFEPNKENEALWVIDNLAKSDGFQQWKDALPLTEKTAIKNSNESIIEKLAAFPLASKTPMEAQKFLYELQIEINGHL